MTPLYAQCIPYNESIKGRIGGNPPINIETEIPEGYAFYATLVHPEKEDYENGYIFLWCSLSLQT